MNRNFFKNKRQHIFHKSQIQHGKKSEGNEEEANTEYY
jgi:hypothetical protein